MVGVQGPAPGVRRAWLAAAIVGTAVVASVITWQVRRAAAEGAPTVEPLVFTGMLTRGDGTPLGGDHHVVLTLWLDASSTDSAYRACTTEPTELVTFSSQGHFRLALDPSCVDAVERNPDLWVGLTLDSTSLPRAKLGAVPYAIEATHAAEAAKAESAPGTVPVGAVVAWHKDLLPPAERVLPEGFVECNGQEITDEESPFYRATAPDLNGTSRFLRGSGSSGGTGGSASATHSHRWLAGATDYVRATWSADGSSAAVEGTSGSNPGGPTYPYAFYWVHSRQSTDKYTTSELTETEPPYMDVVWIMRIK